jgi:hypothetical protein
MPQERLVRAYVNIRIKPGFTADYLGVISNISLTGCLLITKAPLKQAQQVPLVIPFGDGEELHISGTVVRWHDGEGSGYSINFDSLSEAERRALALIIAEGRERRPDDI